MLRCEKQRLDQEFNFKQIEFNATLQSACNSGDNRTFYRALARETLVRFMDEYLDGIPTQYCAISGMRLVGISPVQVYYVFNPRHDSMEVTMYCRIFVEDSQGLLDINIKGYEESINNLEFDIFDRHLDNPPDESRGWAWKDEEYFANGFICNFDSNDKCMATKLGVLNE